MVIYVLVFIIALVAAAWIYNIEMREEMNGGGAERYVTQEEVEAVYGKKVELSEESKASIESIYGGKGN
jgi:hypothetical protein